MGNIFSLLLPIGPIPRKFQLTRYRSTLFSSVVPPIDLSCGFQTFHLERVKRSEWTLESFFFIHYSRSNCDTFLNVKCNRRIDCSSQIIANLRSRFLFYFLRVLFYFFTFLLLNFYGETWNKWQPTTNDCTAAVFTRCRCTFWTSNG